MRDEDDVSNARPDFVRAVQKQQRKKEMQTIFMLKTAMQITCANRTRRTSALVMEET